MPKHINAHFKKLIQKIFKLKPSLRPNLFEISADPFFTNIYINNCDTMLTNENEIKNNNQNNVPRLHCKSALSINTDKINSNCNSIGKYDSSRKSEIFKKSEVNPYVLKLLND